MIKYGIDWDEENALDGGFSDDRFVEGLLSIDEDRIFRTKWEEEQFRKKNNIPSDVDAKDIALIAGVAGKRIRYDKKTDTYYFFVGIRGNRSKEKSTVHIKIDSEIFDSKFDEVIEVPQKNKSTFGVVRIIIPINKKLDDKKYEVHMEYKDTKDFEYRISDKLYSPREDMYFISESGERFNMDAEYEREYDKINVEIEYAYKDAVHGMKFVPIDVKPYQKEDGTWTSDVVANPEKYLKSDLEWYYSDERMVNYIEKKGLLPQDKIDAIRAANYEDIFSFEYKMKSAIKIIPIVLVMIIIAIIVIKKIRKRIF